MSRRISSSIHRRRCELEDHERNEDVHKLNRTLRRPPPRDCLCPESADRHFVASWDKKLTPWTP